MGQSESRKEVQPKLTAEKRRQKTEDRRKKTEDRR
jgi:hypothetical protein